MKKRIVLGTILVLILVVIFACIFVNFSNKEKTKNEDNKVINKEKVKKKCIPFTGGSFSLIFNTNGGEEIDSMSICIACSPDSYLDIPTPKKDGYNFDGWHYDKDFTKKIEFTNTKDFKAIPKYDKDKCMIGYEDIEIFAKWSEVQFKVEEKASSEVSNGVEANNTVEAPAVNTTRIYKPSISGYVLGGYGNYQGHVNRGIVLKILGDRFLYPINDGTVLYCLPRSRDYRYILYMTNINGTNYYVLYYTWFDITLARDFNNDPDVGINDRLGMITYNTNVNSAVSSTYNVAISPVFMNGDYRQIANKMLSGNSIPRVNPGVLFNLHQGDSFYER